jgi:hypothetical protein
MLAISNTKITKNKGSQMGHTKKIFKKISYLIIIVVPRDSSN